MNTTNANEQKHTPGRWHVGQIRGQFQAVYGRLGEQVADCGNYSIPDKEGEANARLIAAAPELLAVLIECEVLVKQYPSIYKQARAAIAKATGGNP